jgi:uncharacterized protein YwgA
MAPEMVGRLITQVGAVNGHKRLQKAIYLLQQMGAPFTEEFEYGIYGPFSRTLEREVEVLVGAGLVTETRSSTGEYVYRPGKNLDDFVASARLPQGLDNRDTVAKVKRLMGEDVRVLEVASTWLFLLRNGYDETSLDDEVRSRKPHLRNHLADAKKLLCELDLSAPEKEEVKP